MIPKPKKTKLSKYMKAKLGKIQAVIPEEKKKAYERDKKCILSWCAETDFYKLDFHHVYYHSHERIYTEERNLAKNGVMLCREHHSKVQSDKGIDLFCRQYLNEIF